MEDHRASPPTCQPRCLRGLRGEPQRPKPIQRFEVRPTTRERALELGADELHARCEWVLRDRPRALRNLRRQYRGMCLWLGRRLNRAAREKG
jgi:hypothetical protein